MITHTRSGEETFPALREACRQAGFDATQAQLIRALDNGIWRLPDGVVVRVHQPGTISSAQNEIHGAYWLYGNGIPVSMPRRSEPVVAAGRPVTFWTDLGPGGPANPADAARILRTLHHLPVPADLRLPSHDPFARFPAQITAAHAIPEEKDWLRAHASRLRELWLALDWPTPRCVIHGDAGPGNTMGTVTGTFLIDWERLSIGHREWDQATAVWHRDLFGASSDDYTAFALVYGHDITTWPSYQIIRDIRSLCATLFALRHATVSVAVRAEADHRLACLRRTAGPTPKPWIGRTWQWTRLAASAGGRPTDASARSEPGHPSLGKSPEGVILHGKGLPGDEQVSPRSPLRRPAPPSGPTPDGTG
ncbi:phosphotransferase family protein [Streptomyces anulatus]|uniref:phosphotransferase family protein n=1 Tax=Streptomyces anulatus TaxID=1892 RepID=UPI0033C3DA0A|nr:aminoglycoside phosphotransferase family protein [Streptomyces anulatus]